MSESEGVVEGDDPTPGRADIWIEKYRPERLGDIVGHEDIVPRLKGYVERDDVPNLLFSGPAGTGKCISGETPVLTNHGIYPVEDVIGDVEGFEVASDDLEVLTVNDRGEFEFVSPSHVYSREAKSVVRIQTRDGNDIKVTPEHQFLVLGNDGFQWIPAEELDPGERIVRPASIPVSEDDQQLRWVERMDSERIHVNVSRQFAEQHRIPIEERYVGKKKRVLQCLRFGKSLEEIVEETDIKRTTAQIYVREFEKIALDEVSTECSLGYLRSLDPPREALRDHVLSIQHVGRFNNRSDPIVSPWELTEELAFLLGMTIGEASINPSGITFFNTHEAFIERYERAVRELFGIDPIKSTTSSGYPYVYVGNTTVVSFLESCFESFGIDNGGIGSRLIHSSESIRSTFLRALFDAEGHVRRRGFIEITQNNKDTITLISYLLTSLGIPNRRTTQEKCATNGSGIRRTYHTLYISGTDHLIRFDAKVGFDHPEKSKRLRAQLDRTTNPNHDTIPTQSAIDRLCNRLAIEKQQHIPETLNPENVGRIRYLGYIEAFLDECSETIEVAQRSLEYLESSEPLLREIRDIPTKWVIHRDEMSPIRQRNVISGSTGIREDALLTYADGRHTPRVNRLLSILEELDQRVEPDVIPTVQNELRTIIRKLGLDYGRLAQGTPHHSQDLRNVVNNEDHNLSSLSRLGSLAIRLEDELQAMMRQDVIADLSHLELLSKENLYFDEVETVEFVEEQQRVYDLTVPGSRNYVAGPVPTIMHNTTAAQAVARELFQEEWRDNFLELNASDERGIDVVRGRIKDFARASFGAADYRIIFLDEADSLTDDAQAALRRTMEQFSHNTRFILSCNYSSKIIDPIQSRCSVFRFTAIPDDAIATRVREIADIEGIEITDDGVDAVVYAANGDMRKAINALQAAAVLDDTVDESTVYTLTSTARPEVVERMVQNAIEGEFQAARGVLVEMLDESGLAGGDVIQQLHRSVWDFDLPERAAVDFLERLGEADYRISEGANERIQLEALLASVASRSTRNNGA